jgi:hypothetical protein
MSRVCGAFGIYCGCCRTAAGLLLPPSAVAFGARCPAALRDRLHDPVSGQPVECAAQDRAAQVRARVQATGFLKQLAGAHPPGERSARVEDRDFGMCSDGGVRWLAAKCGGGG